MIDFFIEHVEASADWRAEKAARYADDRRNRRSSDSLTKLAQELREISADNEHAKTYESLVERLFEVDQGCLISEHESHYIGRYGFDYPVDGDAEEFLSCLTEQYREWLDEADEKTDEEERKRTHTAAQEIAGEKAKEAAEAAKEAAEEAAKEAADEAYQEAYDETYKEVYEKVYRETLTELVQEVG